MKSMDKKKRVSKKKKISWRKHVNINDVEEYLEEKRVEERMGKPLNVIANADLFHIDTNKPDIRLTKAEKRKALANKLPMCYSLLQPLTKVEDPIKKRNHVRTKEERRDPLLRKKDLERKSKGILKAKEKQSIEDKKKYVLKQQAKIPDPFSKDVWKNTVNDNGSKNGDLTNEWISEQTKFHSLSGTSKFDKVLTRRKKLNRVNKFPAIELPHPGTSYNPSFKDHQDLLNEIGEKEKKLIKSEEHLTRVTKTMFKKLDKIDKENSWFTEMSEGLPNIDKTDDNKLEESENDEETGDSIVSGNRPSTKPKTKKQKRKKKEQLLLKAELKKLKLEKRKVADIYKLRQMEKAISKAEGKLTKLRELRKKRMEIRSKSEPYRIGRKKYEEPDQIFNDTHEIAGNLLHMKKAGNLLMDRYLSLQKRNVITPTDSKVIPRKAKVKKYTRSGYKDDWKVTIAGLK